MADVAAPETTITSGPTDGSFITSNTAVFEFTGMDNLTPSQELGFQTKLNDTDWSATSLDTSASFIGLTEGTHQFSVRAVDLAGNVDPTPASRTWTIDTTPPSAPAVITGKVNPATTISVSASAVDEISGISNFEYAVVQCQDVTGVTWMSAGPGPELVIDGLSLTAGERYFLAMRAINGAGLTGPAGFSSAFIAVGEQILSENFDSVCVRDGGLAKE